MSSSWVGRLKEFGSRYGMTGVMLGMIGGGQWAWWRLQDNPTFVRPDERKEFPAITVYKHIKASMGYGEHPEKPHPTGMGGPRKY